MRYELIVVESRGLGIPYAARPGEVIAESDDPSLAELVPAIFAIRHTVLPLSFDGTVLTVAIAAPADTVALRRLRLITRCEIQPLLATRAQVREAISRYYR